MPRVHTGEYGFRLTLVTGYDLTGYDSLQVKIEQPDGTVLTKNASTTDASGGEMYYTVEDGVLDDPGKYEVQGIVAFAGKTLKSDRISFRAMTAL